MDRATELSDVLHELAVQHGIPGVAAGVIVDDQCTTVSYGVTSVDHPLPVDSATLFQVGSITKTFVAAAMMLLARDGRVALDDPVAKHVPDLAVRTGLDFDAITVEHLLSHQAGFDGDHLLVEGGELDALRAARRLFPPGTGFSYGNAAFSLAGAVIEAISGVAFETFVRTELLKPLGLRGACFTADDAITRRVAMPHVVLDQTTTRVIRRGGWQPGWQLRAVDNPAGGLIASVDNLLQWCRFQWTGRTHDGTTILDQSALERLHTPVVRADAVYEVGLDWFSRRSADGTAIDHGGVTVGYISELVVVPEQKLGIVCLTNATNGAAVNVAVRRWALERFGAIHERDPEPDPTLSVDIPRICGDYRSPFAVVTVAAGDAPGTIVASSSQRTDTDGWKPPVDPPVTLAFFADDHARSIDESSPVRIVRFGPDWLQWGLRRAPRLDRRA